MTKELRRCPSCGGDDIRCEDKDTKSFYCYECDLQSRKCETIEEAIEAWNRREPMDKIVEQLESLKEPEKTEDPLDTRLGVPFWNSGLTKAIEIVKGGAG